MKMRVMYSSKKGKVATYAEAIGQACGCLTNDIPPAYPADKERLVIIGVTLKGEPEDKVRRFCSELIPARAQNVALFVDGEKDSAGVRHIRQENHTRRTSGNRGLGKKDPEHRFRIQISSIWAKLMHSRLFGCIFILKRHFPFQVKILQNYTPPFPARYFTVRSLTQLYFL